MRPGSGSTSYNSDMEATPSAFNIMNQRFEQDKQKGPIFHPHAPVDNVDEMDDEERKSEDEDEDEEYSENEEGEYPPEDDP